MKAIAILWNSMEDNFNNAIKDIKIFCNVGDCLRINFGDTFPNFISDIYPYNGQNKWKLDYKINIMNNRYRKNEIVILFLDVPNSKKIYCKRKNLYVYDNVEKIKKFIREKYKIIINDYSFDNIFHMTDDELEYEKTILIIKKHLLINVINNKNGFVKLDKYLINEKQIIRKDELNGKRDKFWFADNLFMYKKSKIDSYELYAELFADEIAKILGIESATYVPAKYNNCDGVITLNFINKDEIFIDASHIINFYLTGVNEEKNIMPIETICKYNNLEQLPTIIENYCLKNNLFYDSNIVIALKRLFAFDSILLQTDRHPSNWGILINKKSNLAKLAPIYDNSSVMGMNKKINQITNSELNAIYELPTTMVLSSKNSFFDFKLNLIRGIKDEELINIFNECINVLKNIDIDLIFNNIEELRNIIIPMGFKIKTKELLYTNIDNISSIMSEKQKTKRRCML